MIHPPLYYFLALAVFILALRRLVPRPWWSYFILAASIASLAIHDWDYCLGLVPALLALWALTFWMDREQGEKKRRLYLTIVALAVATLAYNKYTPQLHDAANVLSKLYDGKKRFGLSQWAMPLGMSYFTFRFIHYAIERYRGRTAPMGPLQFLNYLLFFPTFPMGPIDRTTTFAEVPETELRDPAWIKEALRRIFFGAFKCLALGATLKAICFPYLEDPAAHPGWMLWPATWAAAYWLYYDFSGYSDIAIGTGRLLGYKMMENFNRPYISQSLPEFWERWHISFSYWLRDYVYIPMGGSRVPRARIYFNYLVLMALCGMWHGSEGRFFLWGVSHGVVLILTRMWRSRRSDGQAEPRPKPAWKKWAHIFLTFNFVALTDLMVFFPLDVTLEIFARMFGVMR